MVVHYWKRFLLAILPAEANHNSTFNLNSAVLSTPRVPQLTDGHSLDRLKRDSNKTEDDTALQDMLEVQQRRIPLERMHL